TYLLNGKKTIESRISKYKIAPYNKIDKDDIVFVKKPGGDILAYFTIKEILFIELEDVNISEIKHKYNDRLCVDEKFWISKKDSKYATLIFINDLVKLQPFHINKKGMQTWIKLEK
ncbi:MAG: ASCH domain-containing protein, partial [Peptococcaceae bacterium]|nr:ASCH domain-containing protein [Peptococcaceae bacterium]